MAEEKMERVVLSEEELDKTVGGIMAPPKLPYGMMYQRAAAGNEECEKLMSGFAQDKAENIYRND